MSFLSPRRPTANLIMPIGVSGQRFSGGDVMIIVVVRVSFELSRVYIIARGFLSVFCLQEKNFPSATYLFPRFESEELVVAAVAAAAAVVFVAIMMDCFPDFN